MTHIRLNEHDTRARSMSSALLHRFDARRFPLEARGNEYMGLTLADMAREAVEAAGIRTRGMGRSEIAGRALELRSNHATADFSGILADVANKSLRAGYEQAPRTFTAWARKASAADFKPVNRLQLGEAPRLEKVGENGEFKQGTLREGRETYRLETFGRMVNISRHVIVNDDLGAFTRVPESFGAAAAALETETVYGILAGNPAMSDGKSLFHDDHGNVTTGATVPTADSLGIMRAKLRGQKGLDGATLLNLSPRYLIAPSTRETDVEKLLSSLLTAATVGDVVPEAIRSLVPVIEPYLEHLPGGSGAAFFLAADPSQIDTVEYCYLEGQDGVFIETKQGFDVDGIQIKARLDFAAAAIDWRGMQKHSGEA